MEKKKLFKYRGGDREIFKRDLNSLRADSYWASNIPSLNDPCEALIDSKGYFETLGTLEKALQVVIGNVVDFDEIRSKMSGILQKALTVGVFSLSKNHNDELMWSHYAAAHHGFCIGFNMHNLERSFKKHFYNVLDVKYSKHPPKLKLMEQSSSIDAEIITIQQLIGTKSLRWETEQEVRIITDEPGTHFYDFQSVESIYFELRMPESWKDEMMQALKGRGINYHQMQAEDAYRFTAVPVIDKFLDAPSTSIISHL